MKTFGNVNGLGFGFSAVHAGQRAVNCDPQVIAVSTEGGFRVTGPVTRILGMQHGDYAMFINNIANIDVAIAQKAPALVEFCEEQGLEFGTPEAGIAIHKAYDMWMIAKGITEFNSNGLERLATERLTRADRIRFVKNSFDAMLAGAMQSDDEELKAAISRDGITQEEQINLLIPFVEGKEVPKIKGSKMASPSSVTGAGVNLTFTDSNVWAQLKADLGEDGIKFNRVYSVDLDNIQTITLNDGFKDVNVSAVILGDYVDKAPSRLGKDDDEQ